MCHFLFILSSGKVMKLVVLLVPVPLLLVVPEERKSDLIKSHLPRGKPLEKTKFSSYTRRKEEKGPFHIAFL